MSEWIAVSRTQHAEMHWQPRDGYRFAANQQIIPILSAELPKLLAHYALGFIQQGESYQPVALLGLAGDRNLYLNHDGRWLANYVPSLLRGYPFSMAKAENDQHVLCIAQDNLVEAGQAEPLFDAEGNLAERVQQTLAFLKHCEKNRQATRAASRALGEAGLIEPWPLTLERGEDQQPLTVQGLFRINESALNQLEAEAFAALREHGALPLAYAQLLSMSQLPQLAERARYHARQHAAQPVADSLDSLFGGDEDDVLFNFDD